MTSKLNQPWIPFSRIESLVQLEPAILIAGMAVLAWLVHRFFLRELSPERHRVLNTHFSNLAGHFVAAAILLATYGGLRLLAEPEGGGAVDRISTYLGLVALFSGSMVAIKTSRILVLEYLFLGHMRAGFPILLVNIFTLMLSAVVGGWLFSEIFNINVTPLLATSAVLSLVMGLALQDTLGNLFAGVALQFDKPYEIGDWIEIQSGSQKWIGQVLEISWRATVLIGFSEERLTVPNRVVAQAEVSNFSTPGVPIIRNQIFRLPYSQRDLAKAKSILISAAAQIPEVRKFPVPIVIATEAADSWVSLKLVYYINDYGSQFMVADRVLVAALEGLRSADIQLAGPRLTVHRPGEAVC